jgi:aspartyl-tRNA(Asn)/glutamyl-tRNA(Gln) amidotransferase subunit A
VSKRISVPTFRDRLEAALARLQAVDDDAIFTRLYTEAARAAADRADDRYRAGRMLGPLDGKIVTIKDLFDVAGEPTSAGSAILRNAAPANRDAVVVSRLREAGAIILGKTNMTEFAYSGLGLNPHVGTPRNAIAPDRVPGGSSSGAGVSVGVGIADIAIGTDTGGSVRIPAAFNGIVGFKPTAARVPREGVFPLSYSLDSVGPLAGSVQACADADAVMAGIQASLVVEMQLSGLRLGVPKEYVEDTESPVREAFQTALENLKRVGAAVCDAELGSPLVEMRETGKRGPIVAIEAAEIHAERLRGQAGEIDPNVLARIKPGAAAAAPDYVASIRARQRLCAVMDARLKEWDCLAFPTTPGLPPLLSEVQEREAFQQRNIYVLRNTSFANYFDLCAISLPIPHQPLPVGLMLVARHGDDSKLLGIAQTVERRLRSRT